MVDRLSVMRRLAEYAKKDQKSEDDLVLNYEGAGLLFASNASTRADGSTFSPLPIPGSSADKKVLGYLEDLVRFERMYVGRGFRPAPVRKFFKALEGHDLRGDLMIKLEKGEKIDYPAQRHLDLYHERVRNAKSTWNIGLNGKKLF